VFFFVAGLELKHHAPHRRGPAVLFTCSTGSLLAALLATAVLRVHARRR
jgi:hypothetical protein